MLAGELYCPSDAQLKEEFHTCRRLTRQYNLTTEDELDKRQEILNELMGKIGKEGYIEVPFRCDYGKNTYIGDYFYSNYNLTILDVCEVHIGNQVMMGPGVSIFTAGHPIDAGVRNSGIEFGKPITIGDNVWVGGNTVINPGVTIGDNVVLGSGSVVTKDIPSNVVAAGNPCKIIREITQKDREYWEDRRKQYLQGL